MKRAMSYTSAAPRALHSSRAESSGASLQITGSETTDAPSPRASVLPCSHPLAVAPAVRAEEGDFLAAELALAVGEHRLKLTFFKLIRAHCGAAESDGVDSSTMEELNESGVKSFTSAPLPFAPCATASAMDSVLPVPLQYTTAILLIIFTCLSEI